MNCLFFFFFVFFFILFYFIFYYFFLFFTDCMAVANAVGIVDIVVE